MIGRAFGELKAKPAQAPVSYLTHLLLGDDEWKHFQFISIEESLVGTQGLLLVERWKTKGVSEDGDNRVTQARILIIDDDPDTCVLLANLLRQRNLEVDTAHDGWSGLEKVKVGKPDVVILDVMMPGMDGWETFQRMKRISDVPVLFLTARSRVSDIAHGIEMGAVDYLRKPINIMQLTGKIFAILEANERKLAQRENMLERENPPDFSKAYARQKSFFIIKRAIDILIASIAALIVAPVLLLLAILIKLESKGPVIFKQERIGFKRRGESEVATTFSIFKLRTMYVDADDELHRSYISALINNDESMMKDIQGEESGVRKIINDPRITRVGKFLRKTSLDELPQLWNVLKGDMGMVGPRPAIPYESEMYQQWHHQRLAAKPGITGLWQVTSRSSAGFDEMARMDIWYIENQSLLLDLEILLKTPSAVFSLEGAM